jgi:hypothetical protein
MLQPGSGGVREEQGEVVDDEVVIVRSTQLASQPVVREPQFRPCLPRVLGDGSQGSELGLPRVLGDPGLQALCPACARCGPRLLA